MYDFPLLEQAQTKSSMYNTTDSTPDLLDTSLSPFSSACHNYGNLNVKALDGGSCFRRCNYLYPQQAIPRDAQTKDLVVRNEVHRSDSTALELVERQAAIHVALMVVLVAQVSKPEIHHMDYSSKPS
ncbi:hypothetical protein G7Y79_00022g051730 [Physcia stellaris]|nr:hypothetical protein G7Y79_00022g051730 [Physcia stellaris]